MKTSHLLCSLLSLSCCRLGAPLVDRHDDDPQEVNLSSPEVTPTEYICEATEGVYGNLDGDTFYVPYFYEVEARLPQQDIVDSVLPVLERQVISNLLTEVFEACKDSGTRRLRVSRHLAVVGMSRNPEDLILEDVECTSSSGENTCVVVSGSLTLFTDGATAGSETQVVQDSIQQSMNDGAYDDIPGVERITYVDLVPDPNPGTNAGSTPTTREVNPSRKGVRVGLFMAAGIIVAAMAGIAYRNGRGRDIGEGEHSALDESSLY